MARRIAAMALLTSVALVAAGIGGAWWWVSAELSRPYAGWSGDAVTLELPRGMAAAAMLETLHDAGVIRRPGLVAKWLKWRGGAEALHAGEYRFDRPVSPLEVLDTLRRGEVVLHAVTIPEGLTVVEIATRLAEAGFGTPEDHLEVFRDPSPIFGIDPEAPDLEGYLFPDTYHFPKAETPDRIARAMVERFTEVWEPGVRGAAESEGLTPREAVTLASMIEKETSVPEERWKISRVFHNRRDRNMKMQCDPTVIYALRRAGQSVGRLTNRDLQFESPWNTYRITGLPPGPICSPGKDSLDAAVRPADGDDLYFVAAPGGGHRFSRDLESHLQAVGVWRDYVRSSR